MVAFGADARLDLGIGVWVGILLVSRVPFQFTSVLIAVMAASVLGVAG